MRFFLLFSTLLGNLNLYAMFSSDVLNESRNLRCRYATAGLSRREVLRELGGKLTEVAPRVFSLCMRSHRQLCYTFLRPQEFYEGPFYRGRSFNFPEFMKWYRKNVGAGRFTYATDWSGFNIPSPTLAAFANNQNFYPLTRNESLLLRLSDLLGEEFYLIGMSSYEDRIHEIAHGLYSTNPVYREEVDAVLSNVNLRRIYRRLTGPNGYHRAVLRDEAHAYLIDGVVDIFPENADLSEFIQARKRLRTIFGRYAKSSR